MTEVVIRDHISGLIVYSPCGADRVLRMSVENPPVRPEHAGSIDAVIERAPRIVVGTLAVALLLAGTKWGSYAGVGGIYLTDVLLACGVANHVLSTTASKPPALTGIVRPSPGTLYWVLFGYVVLRLVLSVENFGGDWLRDAAPFVYIGVGLAGASSLARATRETVEMTMKIFWGALIFHLVWTFIFAGLGVDPTGLPRFPGAEVSIGTVRPDIDSAVIGVTISLLARNALLRRRTVLSLLGLCACLVALSGLDTRGGYLALAASVTLGLVLTYAVLREANTVMRPLLGLVVGALIVGAVTLLPSTVVGQRLIATVDSSTASSAEAKSAVGTAAARNEAWDKVIDWTENTPIRQVIGAGPGPNFIVESGSAAVLQGTQYANVRSPHNFFIGLYARFGLVGILLVGAVLVLVGFRIATNLRAIGSNELLFTCAVLAAAILPVAAVGVVLESPFGAVPFWWAVGVLLSLETRHGHKFVKD